MPNIFVVSGDSGGILDHQRRWWFVVGAQKTAQDHPTCLNTGMLSSWHMATPPAFRHKVVRLQGDNLSVASGQLLQVGRQPLRRKNCHVSSYLCISC